MRIPGRPPERPAPERVERPTETASGFDQAKGPRSPSYKAEGVGFEPTKDPKALNGFRDRPVQPLRHPSGVGRKRLDHRPRRAKRRGWDSNPRGGLTPPTRFPVALLKPLGHLSGVCEGYPPVGQRRAAKKPSSRVAHSLSRTPATTSGRWLRAGSPRTSRTLPAAPAFGSGGPVDDGRHAGEDDRPGAHRAGLERDVERRARQPPAAERLGRGAQRQHLGVGGRVATVARARCPPRPITSPSRATTAPIGTSPCSSAIRACSIASRISVRRALVRCVAHRATR